MINLILPVEAIGSFMTLIESVRSLPLSEKLEVMEALWDDLSAEPDQLGIPAWHHDVLKERAGVVASGGAVFLDLDAVKQTLLSRYK